MVFEIVKGGDDSVLISDGTNVRIWDFHLNEVEGILDEIDNLETVD